MDEGPESGFSFDTLHIADRDTRPDGEQESVNVKIVSRIFTHQHKVWFAGIAGLFIMLLVSGCSRVDYHWGWYEVLPTTPQGNANLRFMLQGLWMTLALAGASILISISVGLLVALPGLAKNRLLKVLNRVYVETFRSVPTLALILIVSWAVRWMENRLGARVSMG